MNELNLAQCIKFLDDHPGIKAESNSSGYGIVRHWDEMKYPHQNVSVRGGVCRAIRVFQRKFYSDWTPPEIHDAEWALECIERHHLIVMHHTDGGLSVYAASGSPHDTEPHVVIETDSVVEAIKAWKLKHEPDKVEPKETAMGLLGDIVEANKRTSQLSLPEAIKKADSYLMELEADRA